MIRIFKIFGSVLGIGLFCLQACQESSETLTADQVVSEAIKAAGGAKYEASTTTFVFRDLSYRNSYYQGAFTLERLQYLDSTGTIKDVLDNNGFTRYINGKPVAIADSMAQKYTNSVNSVHYFARLPYGLQDLAVNKKLLGTDTINGTPYYELQITFEQEGGGVDFQDVFVYWFSTKDFSMDFLAYSYKTDGGGVRFRQAINQQVIGGITFSDYINYKPKSTEVVLSNLDSLWEQSALKEVSRIELTNIGVSPN